MTIRNYGFKRNDVDDSRAYRLGGIELPKMILRAKGDWTDLLPNDELQRTPLYDTYGCTVYGTENILQILEKYYTAKSTEYDERYNYNCVKITPPGADPHDVAESFRNDGQVSWLLPITETYEEYCKPRPVPTDIRSKGIAAFWELRHQWVWQRPIDKVTRTRLIKEYLTYSPLGVSVTAWELENGVYVDKGKPNTHWTVIYGWNDDGWKIYDSYTPHRKILSFDHNIECCKRYYLVNNTRKLQLSIFQKILEILSSLLNKPEPLPVFVPSPVSEPEPATKDMLEAFCLAIRDYEGKPGDLNYRNNNPGNCKYYSGGYNPIYGTVKKDKNGFAIFKDYETGWLYLKNLVIAKTAQNPDQTIFQFFTEYAPFSDNNNPVKYAEYVARRLGITVDYKMKVII